MANKIILKKTSTASKVPLSTDLEVGEIAVNLADQKLYSKNAGGTVILVGSGASGGTGDVVGPSSATDNALARFDTTTGKLIQNSVVTIDDTGNVSGLSTEKYTPTTAPSYSQGLVWYDSTEKALAYYNDSSSIAVHVSQDLIFKVINNTGTTIPNGSPVYITGTSSGQTYPNVALAKADVATTSAVIGLTNGAIANGATGYVSSQGTIDNVNTSTFTVGQVLYLSPYSAGQLMNTIPPTGITVQVGVATYIDSTAGHIYVKQTTPLAVPASIITGTLGVANGGTGATTLTGYVKGSGTSALTATSTIPTTDLLGTITNAQLANSAITINGNSTALGGSISVGTVTSVTGTAPVVSSGGNTPAISISQATTSTNGYLSSTDWNTFNNKGSGTVTSVTGTAPVVSSGGTTPAISMAAATTSVSGYLTSTDWNTFNNKQPAGSYLTTAVTSAVAGTGVNVSGATGAVTFSIGQAVATSSNVQFNSLGVGTAGSATAGEIRATNNVTAYYSSDRKWKENIAPIQNALQKVEHIGGKTFDWTKEYTDSHGGIDGYFIIKEDFGVIAQDVQQVFPQAVRLRKDGTLAVDYAKLSALALQAIAELSTKVSNLERKLKD